MKYILQRILGFKRYLYYFALYKIHTIEKDRKEKDFFHFLSLMRDGEGAVIDVGANLGVMTYHLSKSLPGSPIIAIEPMPDNTAILKKLMERKTLTNVELHEIAVGEQTGTATMILPYNKGVKMQGLSHVKHESIEEWNDGDEFVVPMTTIDEIVGERQVQGIKIDVENFEYFSLKGARHTLEVSRPVIYMELWDNENRMLCFDYLKSLGYKIHVVKEMKIVAYDPNGHQTQNFIFIPQS